MLRCIYSFLTSFIKDVLSTVGISTKEWADRRCRKLLALRSKEKAQRREDGRKEHQSCQQRTPFTKKSSQVRREQKFIAPEIFSIVDNYDETTQLFNNIIAKKNAKFQNTRFFLDAEHVKMVGIESLMFIIALITDIRMAPHLRQDFGGSFPKEGSSRDMFTRSGFLDYVRTIGPFIRPKANNIKIMQGNNSNTAIAREMCLLVQNMNNSESRSSTSTLYEILVELMSNTYHHAYIKDPEEISANSWYLYAEEHTECLKFVFLDTGLSIPKTVRKKFFEKLNLQGNSTDALLIKSSFEGLEPRSQTKDQKRGKGLPQIAHCSRQGLIKDFTVYSGRGCCKIIENNEFELQEKSKKIAGTLFTWKINKECNKNVC